MADRQLILDLLARDKTGPATSSAAKNLDEVGGAAEGAAKSAEHLGKEADRADDKVERYGKSNRSAAEHVQHLDREIKLCERELQKLAVAFAEAETAAERADLSKGINKTNAELNRLKKNKNVLKDIIPSEGDAKQFEKTFSNTISDAIDNAKLGPVLAVAIAAGAPLIGATISAAVIGAAGVGGVIGGVLLASKDPRVKAAGTALGQNLLGQLKKDADVFVDPVLVSIDKIENRFTTMNSRISHIFSASSGFLGPLVDGATEGVDGILRGIDSLVTKGKPVIDQLGHSFGQIGNSVGDALEVISGDSEDSAKALKDLTDAISITVEGTGYLVRGLTELYGPITALPHVWTDAVGALLGWDNSAKAANVTATVMATVQKNLAPLVLSAGEAAGKAGMQMQTYADKMDEAASKGRSLYDSQTDVAQAEADAEKAIKANGRTLDLNTQKGRDNRKALSDVAAKLVANYDAYVKVNGEGGAAAGIAARNRDAFVRLATQFTHSKTAAEQLADSMGLLKPKKIDFYANTHDAAARIAALKGQIGGVHGKTITVHVSVTGTERLDALGHRIGGYRAGGGPVTAGKAYIVGEKQPEVFVPNQSGTIIPSISQATGGSSAAMGSGGGGVAMIGFAANADSVMASAFLKVLRTNSAFRAEIKQLVA